MGVKGPLQGGKGGGAVRGVTGVKRGENRRRRKGGEEEKGENLYIIGRFCLSVTFLLIYGSRSVFMGIHGSRLVFHVSRLVFHGFS